MTEVKAATTGPPLSTATAAPTAPVAPAAPAVAPAVAPPPPHDTPAINLSGSLATLSDGSRIEGVVIGEDGAGQPILRTANGSFVIDIEQVLQQNTRLLLQLLSTGADIRAVLLAINGDPLPQPPVIGLASVPADPALAATAADDAALPPGSPAPSQLLPPGRLLATVLPQAAGAAAGRGGLLPAGTTITLLVVGAGETQQPFARPPAAAAGTAPGAHRPADAPPLAGEPAGNTPTAPRATLRPNPAGARADRVYRATVALEASLFPPGSEAAVKPGLTVATLTGLPLKPPLGIPASPMIPPGTIVAPLPAGFTAPPTTAAATVGARLSGVVVGEPAAGRVLLQTPIGLLSVATTAQPPPGTRLSLEIVDLRPPANASAPELEAVSDPLMRLSRDWPALREVLDTLRATDLPVTQHLLDTVIPRPTPNLGASLLLFVVALRGGSIGEWLGRDTTTKLEHAGRADLLRRLDEDFSQIGRLSQQSGHGEWKALMLPFYDGQAITQIKLFSRRHRGSSEENAGYEGGDRFIVELNLSSLGPMQIDGLLQAKHLSLILRTQQPLPQVVRRDINAIFEDAMARSGAKGTLGIQVTRRFPVAPLDELRGNHHSPALLV